MSPKWCGLRLGSGAGAAVVSANGGGCTLDFPPLQLGDVTAHLRPALWLHLRAGPLGRSSPGVAGWGGEAAEQVLCANHAL